MRSDVRTFIEEELRHVPGHTDEETICLTIDYDFTSKLPKVSHKVLILFEPSVVMPKQYKVANWKLFDVVVCFNPWRSKMLGNIPFALQPYDLRCEFVDPEIDRSKNIAFINSNKFSASIRSNYALRRKCLLELLENKIEFSHYGENWNMSLPLEIQKRFAVLRLSFQAREKFSLKEALSHTGKFYENYLGECSNKLNVLANHRMSLIIENQSDAFTEKALDSIASGCVPIYVGPPLGDISPLLDECVLKYSPEHESLPEFLNRISLVDLEMCKSAIKEIQKQKEFWEIMSTDFNWRLLTKQIKEYFISNKCSNLKS